MYYGKIGAAHVATLDCTKFKLLLALSSAFLSAVWYVRYGLPSSVTGWTPNSALASASRLLYDAKPLLLALVAPGA